MWLYDVHCTVSGKYFGVGWEVFDEVQGLFVTKIWSKLVTVKTTDYICIWSNAREKGKKYVSFKLE